MREFLCRISVDLNYAIDHAEELGGFFNRFFGYIPAEYSVKPVTTRFTYCVIKMTAESADKCKEEIAGCWERFSQLSGRSLRVTVVPFADDDHGKLIQTILGVYFGADEYTELCAELYGSIPIMAENGSLGAFLTQNYLFAVDGGNGFTTLLCSFGDFLRRMGVFGDRTDVKKNYSEFKIGKETEADKTSANDLYEKFRGDYLDDCNVVGIDVSYYLEGDKTDELRPFLQMLYRFQQNVVFAFRIPYLEKSALDRVTAIFEDVALTRTVKIPPLHDIILAEEFWDMLRKYGVTPDKSVIETFFAKVAKEKSDGRFYGFKTVDKIACEMILKKASKDAETKFRGEETEITILKSGDLPEDFAKIKKKKNGYDELGELIGMEEIAKRVREIVAQVKVSIKNEKLDRPCIHMRFLGHPGTGKTTVARIIGRIFREEGILRKGAFLEYSARSLCAEYVGQTAVRTASICRDAYGSVLFLDEAYSLYDGEHATNDYGKEALTTLISEMENHRDDMLVIMAGYTEDMDTLMQGNAGLRSRMPYAITFPNYTKDQLFEIFMLMVKNHFSYTEQLEEEAKKYFTELSDDYIESKEFANARFVRNLYERTWSKGALRAALSGIESFELTKEDFLAASAEKEFSEKLFRKKAKIGF